MSLPQPEVGLVISYSYLWSEEAKAGRVEGRKTRPCAIVLVVRSSAEGLSEVTVAPITHSPPTDAAAAVEIPAAVKRHLGLDDQPSWIVVDDVNVFAWPGYDLRPIPGRPQQYSYGLLPPRLFEIVRQRFAVLLAKSRADIVSRDDAK